MEFSIKSGHPEKQRTACVVVGVYEPRRLSDNARRLDDASDGHLSAILRRGDLEGKLGQSLLLHNVPGTLSDRVLLIGCGRERELGDAQYRKIMAKTVDILHDMGSMETVCYLTELNVRGRDTHWRVRYAIEIASTTLYRFDQLKSKKDITRRPLRKIIFTVSSRRELPLAEQASAEAQAIATGVKLTKNLANLPPNICTPSYLSEQAHKLCANYQKTSAVLRCSVLDEADMRNLGMGAFLAVSQGSAEPPKMIILDYQGGGKNQAPIVLVGKGVTFDTGGLCLKKPENMPDMKYDMCGAASVLGVLSAVAELQLPVNLIGIMPCTENSPSGTATRPSDIVTSLSGQTLEIINTDAEGRLILCDALTYCERYKPEVVIDIATLTGACVIALGHHAHGLFSNHSPLTNELLNAGRETGDRAWEMPLWDDYQELLDSPFADMKNVGDKSAGAISAACFLSRFTKKYQWAHLDVAGTAVHADKKKGATGRPVPLLTQYIINCVRGTETLSELPPPAEIMD